MQPSDNEDMEAWLVEVELAAEKIRKLQTGELSVEEFDKQEARKQARKKREEQEAQERERKLYEQKRQGRAGKGQNKDYFHFCKVCMWEYELPTPICQRCQRPTITQEERYTYLLEKVKDYKEEKMRKEENRKKWELQEKTQKMLWKNQINYKRWDYFEPESDEEIQTEPIVPKNDPNFQALEKDMQDRKKKREESNKQAEIFKQKGNEYMKNQQYDHAVMKYSQALEIVKDIKAIWLNRALAYLKLKKFRKCISDCTRVIEYAECFEKGFTESRESCFKAFIRRGTALKERKEYESALKDAEEAIKLYPNDKEAITLKKDIQLLMEHKEKLGQISEAQAEQFEFKDQINKFVTKEAKDIKDEDFLQLLKSMRKATDQAKSYFCEKKGLEKVIEIVDLKDEANSQLTPHLPPMTIQIFIDNSPLYKEQLYRIGYTTLVNKIESLLNKIEANSRSIIYDTIEDYLHIIDSLIEEEKTREMVQKEETSVKQFYPVFWNKIVPMFSKEQSVVMTFINVCSNACFGPSNLKIAFQQDHKNVVKGLEPILSIPPSKAKILPIQTSIFNLLSNFLSETSFRLILIKEKSLFEKIIISLQEVQVSENSLIVKWTECALAVLVNLSFQAKEDAQKLLDVLNVEELLLRKFLDPKYRTVTGRALQVLSKLNYAERDEQNLWFLQKYIDLDLEQNSVDFTSHYVHNDNLKGEGQTINQQQTIRIKEFADQFKTTNLQRCRINILQCLQRHRLYNRCLTFKSSNGWAKSQFILSSSYTKIVDHGQRQNRKFQKECCNSPSKIDKGRKESIDFAGFAWDRNLAFSLQPYYVKVKLYIYIMSETQTLDKAMNMLVYGYLVRKWDKSGKTSREAFFYIHEKDSTILQWISQKKEYNKQIINDNKRSRIDLSKVSNVNCYPTLNGFSKRQSIPRMKNCSCFTLYLPPQQGYFLQISVGQLEMVIELQTIYEQQLFKLGVEEFSRRAKERLDFENPILQLTTRYFVQADKDGNQKLSKQEIRKLFNQMQIHLQEQFFDQFFNKIDLDKNGSIDIKEFQQMTLMLMEKKEVFEIFEKYSVHQVKDEAQPQGSQQTILNKISRKMSSVLNPLYHRSIDTVQEKSEYISEEQLKSFFLDVQHQDISLSEIRKLINLYGDDEQKVNVMTFTNILFSKWNEILSFQPQRMDFPLTDYYIFSSHNTYLLSNQITGKSSVQAYKNAFYMGVKCVEIDCWDGDVEPVVTHGHTLVNKLSFSDVVKAIKDYGFVRSPYPVIVSIELHCSEPFQIKMAKILRDILMDRLYTVPSDWRSYEYLPSPEQLMNKVIVKGSAKLNSLNLEQKLTRHETEQDSSISFLYQPVLANDLIENNLTDMNNLNLKSEYYSPYLSDAFLNQDIEDCESQILQTKPDLDNSAIKQVQTDSQLQKCYGIIAQKLNNDLQQPESCWLTSSISEETVNRILETKCSELMNYTKTNLIRVYPKGTRIKSDNYSVLPSLIMGCQLVALNVQSHDLWLLIYRSFFSQGEGYLLKPEYLRYNGDFKHQLDLLSSQSTKKRQFSNHHQPSIRFKQTSQLQLKNQTQKQVQSKLELTINFISAQQIPQQSKQTISPYLIVQLKGIPFDEQENQHYESIIVKENGFNPIFNLHTKFIIHQPYFATILIEVKCQNNGRVAQAAIPADNLRSGYRVIKLENLNGYWEDGSFIFVKVDKN